eukprot:TRINITY_DN1312_c0_g1_i4.p1 TRINITY_DN1312_c0_g1~~TRINITY_DN1312_c0_g1_i4.p1  ORF type:complete len:376 (+),score=74.60 TRINITY_DN1312_c0_g1_i4:136-1263(+)
MAGSTAVKILLHVLAVAASQDVQQSLQADDECLTSTSGHCGLSVLQLRGGEKSEGLPIAGDPGDGPDNSKCAYDDEQCGGTNPGTSNPWTGKTCCTGNSKCVYKSQYYSSCKAPDSDQPDGPAVSRDDEGIEPTGDISGMTLEPVDAPDEAPAATTTGSLFDPEGVPELDPDAPTDPDVVTEAPEITSTLVPMTTAEHGGNHDHRGNYYHGGNYDHRGNYYHGGNHDHRGNYYHRGNHDNGGNYDHRGNYYHGGNHDHRGNYYHRGNHDNGGNYDHRHDNRGCHDHAGRTETSKLPRRQCCRQQPTLLACNSVGYAPGNSTTSELVPWPHSLVQASGVPGSGAHEGPSALPCTLCCELRPTSCGQTGKLPRCLSI